MRASKKALVVILFLGTCLFGFSQYVSATNIDVAVSENEFVEKNDAGSIYNLELEFSNPSLLMLSAGKTDFFISVEDTKVADGELEPFLLSSLSKTTAKGTYVKDMNKEFEESSPVKISGTTKYDMLFASLEVPFIYIPTEEQAREFIHQN